MIKVTRTKLSKVESLQILHDNWIKWGEQYEAHRNKEENGQDFSWRQGIHEPLITELSGQTNRHCTFCDSFPFDMTKETIEHFRPKNEYPKQAYEYRNLFYCCDKCQSKSNKKYISNLKPDHDDYTFDKFFYVDLELFEIKIHTDILEEEQVLAQNFLDRYGINERDRLIRRKGVYYDIKNYFKAKEINGDERRKEDFPYRYMYDLVEKLRNIG